MPKSILVVDDSKDLRYLSQRILLKGGYRCAMAENGKQACNMLMDGFVPALILLDLTMPVMTGWDFLHWKNSKPEYRSIPVVVVSAETSGTPFGVNSFLAKPFNDTTLMNEIRKNCGDERPHAHP